MNYMHIHFTDVASFPMASNAYPQLAAEGRMSRLMWKSKDTDAVYTAEDLKSLVAYAAERGVRVVPEFDMPGHGAWNYGMPDICLKSCPSVLDVTQDKVYDVLTTFLGEMADIFPDPVLMLGGDEVGLSCHDADGKAMESTAFDLDPAAVARMKNLGINSSQATDYFWKQITSKVMASPNLKDKTLQIWYCPDCHTGDPPLTTMPKTVIADVWGSLDYAADACKAGWPRLGGIGCGRRLSIGIKYPA